MTDAAADYYDEYWTRERPPPLDDPLTSRRRELLRQVLRETGARRVLDVGAGSGDLVAALRGEGVDAVGMDVSRRAVEVAAAAHPGCPFVAHSAEELPWPVESGAFDVVVAFELIEHLLRPRRLLEGAHEALRPGGAIALTTPYHGLLKNLALAAAAFDRHFDVEGDHIRFFSDRSLRALFAQTGYEIVRFTHFGRVWGLWAGVFAWARKPS